MVRKFASLILPKTLVLRQHELLKGGYSPEMEARLQRAAKAFLDGLHASIQQTSIDALYHELKSQRFDDWERGFAFEGAAMGLGILQEMPPWNTDWIPRLLERCGGAYVHLIHVGVGWANAFVIWRRPRDSLNELDPLLGWLSVDGYGFYRGIKGRGIPTEAGHTGRVMRQGYGRALWFLTRGSVTVLDQVMEDVRNKSPEWSDDLWSGIGLAAVYAGRLSCDDLRSLRAASGSSTNALSQGAAFAAKARMTGRDYFCEPASSDPSSERAYVDLACGVLCGCDAEDAARITDEALLNLPSEGEIPAYEEWRLRVQRTLGALQAPHPESLQPPQIQSSDLQLHIPLADRA